VLSQFSIFIAVLIGFGRLYKDSEMVAFAAAGVGVGTLMKGLVFFWLAVTVIDASLSMLVSPWAKASFSYVKSISDATSELEKIPVGEFKEIDSDRKLTIYVSRISKTDGLMHDIYIQQQKPDGTQVVMRADSALHETDAVSKQRYLVLRNGFRYEGVPGTANFRVVKFKKIGIHLRQKAITASTSAFSEKTMRELWGSQELGALAELHWRLHLPLSTLLLSLLAVLLSRTSRSQGQYSKIMGAVVIFIGVNYLMGAVRSWIENGLLIASVGFWIVQCALLLLLWLLISREHTGRLGFALPFRKQN
jgi:lipopolysaccharide export system permease protein